jgi:hypothetical protein
MTRTAFRTLLTVARDTAGEGHQWTEYHVAGSDMAGLEPYIRRRRKSDLSQVQLTSEGWAELGSACHQMAEVQR